MLLSFLILLPLFGSLILLVFYTNNSSNTKSLKITALTITIINLILSLAIWFLFDNSSKHFQYIQEHYIVGYYDFYLGLDGLSIYFVLLTTLIAPISIISNWKSIDTNVSYFLVIILLLESALLLIYSVLDILMFYIFFESILAPLFVLIGFFGSTEKMRASFYFFLYTFLGSLFMLLSIITISSLTGCTDMDIIYKTDYVYLTQVFLFIGIFIAFAVKTPVIFLNSWLLKAHVESPLSGSVLLAAIVLKLSLYGVFRLILPLVPKSFMFYTYIVFVICVITIVYASFSTLRTTDVKELIAYSSVSHAAVYLAGILSNVLQGIQGGIILGLAHGFVSSGLFISGGGVLYDRSGTRTINYYGGLAQVMPIFATIFFILCLGNCGAPLTLNFVGEFMSLYGVFERLSLAGILGSSSIVLSAAYTIYMFNRVILGGVFKGWSEYLSDLTKREYSILLLLVIFTVLLGIYPSIFLDSLNYAVSSLIFGFDSTINNYHITPVIEVYEYFY
jgi:NADH-ubiquinone oxidoreductase chain 4